MLQIIRYRSFAATAFFVAMGLITLNVLNGCTTINSSSTQPSGLARNNAENDPMGYSPDFSDTDISGGKINEYDPNAMNRDVDHFLNP